jgi:hypothetical protein
MEIGFPTVGRLKRSKFCNEFFRLGKGSRVYSGALSV